MFRSRRLSITFLAVTVSCPVGCTHGGRKPTSDCPAAPVEVIEEFWPDRTPRLRKEVVRSPDGTPVNHGAYTRWHDNGRKEYEATFIHGKKEGVATLWHKNGQKWTQEHYINGRKHGPRITWDENGTKRKEEHFFEGKPHGTWTVWNDKGRIKAQNHFEHGNPRP